MLIGAWQPRGLDVDIEHLFARADHPPPVSEMRRVQVEGKRLLVTVEPWSPWDQPTHRSWMKALRGPEVWVRFGHEMNLSFETYPWSGANHPTRWKGLWESWFTGMPENVRRVFCPNVGWDEETRNYHRFLQDISNTPHIVGLDGYQWGTEETVPMVFRDSLASMAETTNLPLLICETAAPQPGKNQQGWIRGLRHALIDYPHEVTGVVWFNEPKEKVWTLRGPAKRAFSALRSSR